MDQPTALEKLYTTTRWGRWLVVAGGFLINLALGVLYAWSIFRSPLAAEFGWTGIQTSLPFAFALTMNALFMIPAGRMQDRLGPMKVGMVGGVVLGLAFILTSFAKGMDSSMAFLWVNLTYGVLGGIGIGIGYAVPIATAVKWFPDKRGLVCGLAVFGFGFSTILFGPLAATMIGYVPETVSNPGTPGNWSGTFFTLGIVFMVMVVGGSCLLRIPPAGWEPPAPAPKVKRAKVDFSPGELIRLPQYYMLVAMYACAALAGLMTINFAAVYAVDVNFNETAKAAGLGFFNLIPIVGFNVWTGATAPLAAVATGWLAMWNGLGRLIVGAISDRLGRTQTMLLNFSLIAATMLLLMVAGTNPWILILGYMFVGLTYGACLALFPATNADWFGTKHVGVNYGLIFLGCGIGGVLGTLIGGSAKDVLAAIGGYSIAFLVAAALAAIAALLAFTVKPPVKAPW